MYRINLGFINKTVARIKKQTVILLEYPKGHIAKEKEDPYVRNLIGLFCFTEEFISPFSLASPWESCYLVLQSLFYV